jgi:hypothetical protein
VRAAPEWSALLDDFDAVQARLRRLSDEVVPSLKYWLFQPSQLTQAIPTLLSSRLLLDVEKAEERMATGECGEWGSLGALAGHLPGGDKVATSMDEAVGLERLMARHNTLCQALLEDCRRQWTSTS